MAGQGPQRISRRYAGKTSTGATRTRWHRTAAAYDPREVYQYLQTLCGYEILLSDQLRGRHQFSTAVKPRGELCSRCEARAGAGS